MVHGECIGLVLAAVASMERAVLGVCKVRLLLGRLRTIISVNDQTYKATVAIIDGDISTLMLLNQTDLFHGLAMTRGCWELTESKDISQRVILMQLYVQSRRQQ